MRQVRETIAHLVNLNLFDDVQVLSEPSGRGGVRLLYRLVPAHPVDRVEFRGSSGWRKGDLRRAVSDRFGDIPRAAQVDERGGVLRTLYRDRGYPSASVNGEVVESHDPDRATLVIERPGGPAAADRGRAARRSSTPRSRGCSTERPAIATGVPYDKAAVDRELQRWTDRMRGRGYYEARASHGVLFPPDGAVLSVSVTRGPRITVAFSGDALSENERERLVPIRAEASADEDLLEDSARAIEVFLRGRGYRQARVTYTRTPGPRDVVITFDVRRGPHFVFGSVDVTGAPAMTAPEVREFLLLKEGEPFTEAALGAGVAALRNAYLARGYALVKVEPVRVGGPAGRVGRRRRARRTSPCGSPKVRAPRCAPSRSRARRPCPRTPCAPSSSWRRAGPSRRARWPPTATASTSSTATAATTRWRCDPRSRGAENDTRADVRYRDRGRPAGDRRPRDHRRQHAAPSPRRSSASCW